MPTPFESVARAAIEEILMTKLHETRHGFVVSKEGYQEIVDDFYDFLKTSRNLKDKGDRLIGASSGGGGSIRGASRSR